MTKKSILIELGQSALSGGDVAAEIRNKYHSSVVEQFLGLAWADIIQEQFKLSVSGNDFTIFDNFAKPFYADVLYDDDREEAYFVMPVSIIPLQPKQAAVRSISLKKSQQLAFAPIQNASMPMWSELEAMRIDNVTVSYYLEGNNVYFPFTHPETLSKLLIKVICPFDALDDDDDVFVPGGQNEALFMKMFQIMVQQGNKNVEYNENNSTQTQ